jgi:septum formation protein
LLRAVGVPFRVVPSRIEEIPRKGESPMRFVRRAAREKGEEVAARNLSAFILSADTIVVANGRILGKPADRKEGRRMLSLLAGRVHLVHTAACLLRADGGYRDGLCVTTRVRFRSLTGEEISAYLRTGESDDKAGAYAAQGAGNLLIDRISGSFTNVIGLPMTQTLAMLARAGLLAVSRKGTRWYTFAGKRS